MSKSILISVAVAALAAGQVYAEVLHVDADAPGPVRDGTSWATAFIDLQGGISAALAGDDIWVAAGTYTPDGGSGNRLATFPLANGIALRGGFAGHGAPDPDERDITAYETILSGDLVGNDGPDFGNYADNSYHVVTYSDGTAVGVVLDGFTVTAGYANGTGPAGTITNQGSGVHIRGGSLRCIPGGPTLRNCTFRDNWSLHHGAVNDHALATVIDNCVFRGNFAGTQAGGLLIHSGSTTVTNTTFIDNTTDGNGAGVWSSRDSDATCIAGLSRPTFSGCDFINNTANSGGGFFAEQGSSPEFQNCTFVNNTANGGGLWVASGSARLTDCVFDGNTADDAGGAIFAVLGVNLELERCTLLNNSARWSGAGINAENTSVTATDCVFDGNVVDRYPGGAGVWSLFSAGLYTRCTFRNNEGSNGSGIYQHGDEAFTVTDCVFEGNHATNDGAGFVTTGGSPRLTNCLFESNVAGAGAAASTAFGSQPVFEGCVFTANSAIGVGATGGALHNNASSPQLIGCTFTGNTAGLFAGAVYNWEADVTLTDCTFSDNYSDSHGGAVSNYASTVAFSGCSFQGNSSGVTAGAVRNSSESTVFYDGCTFLRDPALLGTDLVDSESTNTVFTNCVLEVSAFCSSGAELTLVNSIVRSNGIAPGARLNSSSGCRTTLINTIFSGNSNGQTISGGITVNNDSGPLTVINSTFSANEFDGSVIRLMPNASATIRNSIFWGGSGGTEAEQFFVASGATLDIQNSLVQGWTGILGGVGNSGADPMFMDTDGDDNIPGTPDDDLRLSEGSPAIDAGNNAWLPGDFADLDGDGDTVEPIPFDLGANERLVDGAVDMGAYEFQGAGDPIPTVSAWGLVSMVCLLGVAATVMIRRSQRVPT